MKIPILFPTILLASQFTHVLSAPVSTHGASDLMKRDRYITSTTQGTPGTDGTSNTEHIYADGNNIQTSTSDSDRTSGSSTSNGATSSGLSNSNLDTSNNQANSNGNDGPGNGATGTYGVPLTGNSSTSTTSDTRGARTGNRAGTSSGGGSSEPVSSLVSKLKAAAHKSTGVSSSSHLGSWSGTTRSAATGRDDADAFLEPSSSSSVTIDGATIVDHSVQGTRVQDGLSNMHNVYADGNNNGDGGAGGSASASAGGSSRGHRFGARFLRRDTREVSITS